MRALGTFGGSCGPDQQRDTYQESGLKIGASRKILNHLRMKPNVQGELIVTMAREIHGITEPSEKQTKLL